MSECYKNEKRIDQACKQLTNQSNLLIKQSQGWISLIGQFTAALKVVLASRRQVFSLLFQELGDVENYSKIIERECATITNTLVTVHQEMQKRERTAKDSISEEDPPPVPVPAPPSNE